MIGIYGVIAMYQALCKQNANTHYRGYYCHPISLMGKRKAQGMKWIAQGYVNSGEGAGTETTF